MVLVIVGSNKAADFAIPEKMPLPLSEITVAEVMQAGWILYCLILVNGI